MKTLARPRKQRSKPDAAVRRKIIAQLKASEEFGAWFERMLAAVRLPSPVFLEHAIIEHAKRLGFAEDAPER